jgi:hypothetical protein
MLANHRRPTMPLDACTALPRPGRANLAHGGVSLLTRRYRGRVPNPPEPEIIQAAAEIGIDPQALRDQLDTADLTPARPDQQDDLPKLLARLEELDRT